MGTDAEPRARHRENSLDSATDGSLPAHAEPDRLPREDAVARVDRNGIPCLGRRQREALSDASDQLRPLQESEHPSTTTRTIRWSSSGACGSAAAVIASRAAVGPQPSASSPVTTPCPSARRDSRNVSSTGSPNRAHAIHALVSTSARREDAPAPVTSPALTDPAPDSGNPGASDAVPRSPAGPCRSGPGVRPTRARGGTRAGRTESALPGR